MNQEIQSLLRQSLLCSLFVDPTDPGLTHEEMLDVGRQAGFRAGTVADALTNTSKDLDDRGRYMPRHNEVVFSIVMEADDPPLFDTHAADFVKGALNDRIEADTVRGARLDRSVAVARAIAAGHDRAVVEGAINCLVLAGQLRLKDGVLTPNLVGGLLQMTAGHRPPRAYPSDTRRRALAHVRDVVARRSDGRPRHAEPLDAFPDALERIGYPRFRTWWQQTVAELRRMEPTASATSCTVLAAALVEGALTFAAKHARDRSLDAFRSNWFEGEPRNWRADRLIDSAATGGSAAVLPPPVKALAEHLNMLRQRIHAGRMLSDFPGPTGPTDLNPEEARIAKDTADQVVRAVLNWLDRVAPQS